MDSIDKSAKLVKRQEVVQEKTSRKDQNSSPAKKQWLKDHLQSYDQKIKKFIKFRCREALGNISNSYIQNPVPSLHFGIRQSYLIRKINAAKSNDSSTTANIEQMKMRNFICKVEREDGRNSNIN
jgi:hypothetical protein